MLSLLCAAFALALSTPEVAARAFGQPILPSSGLDTCGSRAVRWRPERTPRVVGGQVPPYGAIPWQVELKQGGSHMCGGSLLSSRLVLTAAHCAELEGLVVVAGAHGPTGTSPFEQSARVERTILHPEFRKMGPYSHDIAVLYLKAPGLRINALVKPACLASSAPAPGAWCEVSGWGAADAEVPSRPSPVLRAAAVPVLAQETCRKRGIYGDEDRRQKILDSMLCAGHLSGGVDACGGDSGGPLVCEKDGRLELAGLVSWGDGCARRDRPGVYTRVHSFLPWIREVAGSLGVLVSIHR